MAHTILLAEDQADIRDLIELNLRSAGYAACGKMVKKQR